MDWLVEESSFVKEKIEQNGSKFILGNGYMGYRGTLEEFGANQLTAVMLNGVYDRVPGKWREPVNMPNGFFVRYKCDGEDISVLSTQIISHNQSLDMKKAVHVRKTVFKTKSGKEFTLVSERFLSGDNIHLMCMKNSFSVNADCEIVVETGYESDIWDINGPHLEERKFSNINGLLSFNAISHELRTKVSTAEAVSSNYGLEEPSNINNNIRTMEFKAEANKEYTFNKYVAIFTSLDAEDPEKNSIDAVNFALTLGYEATLERHENVWKKRWDIADVKISGDSEGEFALRYSIYMLLAISPTHSDKVSIPARGLSGQMYKGAIFWDTEMFMLPVLNLISPEISRNCLLYRYNTLDAARKKAAEYGFRGAFYAWESQDNSEDACTLFNVTDVFTNRPMRTYFRDKQVHISADISHAIWEYYVATGDDSIFIDGGAEVILECARFFYSYSYFKSDKGRYEILDVTGPDEYHERVNNNAFTNMMVKRTLEIALDMLDLLKAKYFGQYAFLIEKLDYKIELANIRQMLTNLYIPQPNGDTNIIEQFDGYMKLEDTSIEELKGRVINKNEYWGGGNGIATTTRILKQADTVLMLNLFKDRYSDEVKRANWEYYEKRTEHGSSLSACVYAMLASNIGDSDWGYKFFKKTATIDLTGEGKQYVGTLYIGGTHPAANGGAFMAAVYGFAGLSIGKDRLILKPALPSNWDSISFSIIYRGVNLKLEISQASVTITSDANASSAVIFEVKRKSLEINPGKSVTI